MKNRTSFIFAIVFAFAVTGCDPSTQSPPAATPGSNSGSPTSSNSSSPAPSSTAKDIAGSYTITGTNENGGGNYDGALNITKRDDVYQFSWASGGRTYDGVGVQDGNNVAVSFTEGADGKGCGVVLYTIGGNGDLDGTAGYWGVNESESEKAVRKSGTDLEGSYEVSGSNPGGEAYKGTLDVKKDGDGYTFQWNTGSTATGFGIRQGDVVAVGLGQAQCGFVLYDAKSDGSLEGKWGGQASKRFGTEVAKRK